ncbi:hypothetical protein MRX96_005216 [Rhipicephalus microplus]
MTAVHSRLALSRSLAIVKGTDKLRDGEAACGTVDGRSHYFGPAQAAASLPTEAREQRGRTFSCEPREQPVGWPATKSRGGTRAYRPLSFGRVTTPMIDKRPLFGRVIADICIQRRPQQKTSD